MMMKKQTEVVPQQESSGVVIRESLKDIADKAAMEIRLRNENLTNTYKKQLRQHIRGKLLSSAKNGKYSLEIIPITLSTRIEIYPEIVKYKSYSEMNKINSEVCKSVAKDNNITFKYSEYSSLVFDF